MILASYVSVCTTILNNAMCIVRGIGAYYTFMCLGDLEYLSSAYVQRSFYTEWLYELLYKAQSACIVCRGHDPQEKFEK